MCNSSCHQLSNYHTRIRREKTKNLKKKPTISQVWTRFCSVSLRDAKKPTHTHLNFTEFGGDSFSLQDNGFLRDAKKTKQNHYDFTEFRRDFVRLVYPFFETQNLFFGTQKIKKPYDLPG